MRLWLWPAVVTAKHIDYSTVISFVDFPRAFITFPDYAKKKIPVTWLLRMEEMGTALMNGNRMRKTSMFSGFYTAERSAPRESYFPNIQWFNGVSNDTQASCSESLKIIT